MNIIISDIIYFFLELLHRHISTMAGAGVFSMDDEGDMNQVREGVKKYVSRRFLDTYCILFESAPRTGARVTRIYFLVHAECFFLC